MFKTRLALMAVAVCSIVLALTTFAPAIGNAPASDPGPQPSVEQRLAGEISFRQAAGLNADENYIKSVDEQNSVDPDWGVALTQSERAFLERQQDIGKNIKTIIEYGRSTEAKDSYAGLYKGDDDLVYVGFTQNADARLNELKKQFNYPELLRLFPATYSETDLRETSKEIFDDREMLKENGIDVYATGVRISENKVYVEVKTADDETIAF